MAVQNAVDTAGRVAEVRLAGGGTPREAALGAPQRTAANAVEESGTNGGGTGNGKVAYVHENTLVTYFSKTGKKSKTADSSTPLFP